jgi:hypothetical protein
MRLSKKNNMKDLFRRKMKVLVHGKDTMESYLENLFISMEAKNKLSAYKKYQSKTHESNLLKKKIC